MAKHYKYGGSTAARTGRCTGWVALSKWFPRQPETEYTAMGTLGHTACEMLWKNPDIDEDDLLDLTYSADNVSVSMTEEFLNSKVYPAYDALLDLLDKYDDEADPLVVHPELTFEYDELTGGTGDIVAINQTHLIMADYKFGDGKMVSAENNEQALFYMWCLLYDRLHKLIDKYPHVTTMVIAIIQPSDRKQSILETFELTREDVEQFGVYMDAAIDKAEEACAIPVDNLTVATGVNSPLLPYLETGDHCTFCPAAALCPRKLCKAEEALRIDVVADTAPELLAEALELASEVEKWASAVFKFAHEQQENGVHIPGWKRVAKRPTTNWIDENEALKWLTRNLGATVAKRVQPITVAQAKKEAKKAGKELDFNKYTVTKSSGTNIVREDDKRAALPSARALEVALAKIK